LLAIKLPEPVDLIFQNMKAAHRQCGPARWRIMNWRRSHWQRRTGNQLANDFFEAGDILNAHSIYASLLELSPEPTWRLPLIYQIALCYERLGLLDRAQTSYQSIVAASGTAPPPELAELFRMAAWRLEHLNWRERLEKQVSVFFTITTGKPAAATAALPRKTAATP
jgi:hypothetical protein